MRQERGGQSIEDGTRTVQSFISSLSGFHLTLSRPLLLISIIIKSSLTHTWLQLQSDAVTLFVCCPKPVESWRPFPSLHKAVKPAASGSLSTFFMCLLFYPSIFCLLMCWSVDASLPPATQKVCSLCFHFASSQLASNIVPVTALKQDLPRLHRVKSLSFVYWFSRICSWSCSILAILYFPGALCALRKWTTACKKKKKQLPQWNKEETEIVLFGKVASFVTVRALKTSTDIKNIGVMIDDDQIYNFKNVGQASC